MSNELIPFSSIPSRWDWEYDHGDEPYPYTDGQEEAAEFLSKMDWEGGIDGLIGYGGAEVFPAEIRHIAERYEDVLEELRKAVNEWAAERGVVY